MKQIRRMMNRTIIEITLLIVLCIVSFVVFNTYKLEGVEDNVIYTDINVFRNRNTIAVNDFPKESQVTLMVTNASNTKEKYNVLLTSYNSNLNEYEDCLKVKINDKEYLLKDLKVADNYFLIDEGDMKANIKEIDLYFAIDEEYDKILNNNLSLEFVNDISI